MNFADRVKETTTSLSAAVILLAGAAPNFRSFASSLAVGDTDIPVSMDDGNGNWENGAYTLTAPNTLTRTSIYASSNGGAPTVFPAGVKDVFCTLSSEPLSRLLNADDGVTVDQLSAASGLLDGDLFAISRPGIGDLKVSWAVLRAAIGGTPGPGDTTPPTFVSAQVANATPGRIDISMNETLANSVPPASAFTVSGGRTVSAVSINGTIVSLTLNTPYVNGDVITVGYTQPGSNPRLQDAAANATATFSNRSVANNIGAAGSTVTGVSVSPPSPTVAGGGTQQFTATVTGTGTPSQGVNWAASAGTISNTGIWTAPAATSSAQNVTITATSQQDGTRSGTATAVVSASAPAPQYILTGPPLTNTQFPASPTTMTASSDNYAGSNNPTISIKTAENGVPNRVRMVWGTSPTVPPCGFNDKPLPAGATGNNTARDSGIIEAGKLGSWTGPASATYGLWRAASLFAWGSAGSRYLWALTDDGFAGVLKDSGGAPVVWTLVNP